MAIFIEGDLSGKEKKIAVVIARFNDFITGKLLSGALDIFKREGVSDEDIDVIYVPGSFEIPAVAAKIDKNEKYDGILCLGAVIRGETPHFDFIGAEVSKGISQVALNSKKAVSYGIITADTVEQAINRAGTKMGNRGAQSALSLLELMNLKLKIKW